MLVDGLCDKARENTWRVLRTSYREIICAPPATGSLTDTNDWLARALVLPSRSRHGSAKSTAVVAMVEDWLEERCTKGEVKKKEGENMQGRWILVKPAVR